MYPTNGTSKAAPMQIGIMAEEVQLMDICCVDCLGNVSTYYTSEAASFGGDKFLGASKEMKFHWIASSLEPARTTPGMLFKPSITYDDCPRDLDVLLIGGPLPSHRPEAADRFMKEAFPRTKVVMTTCVGSWWLASSGVLEGHKCTTNREALDIVRKVHPEVQWQDQRWVVEQKRGGGELWTSGGAQAGIDMVATWVRKNFDQSICDWGLGGLDINEKARGQFY